MSYHTWTTYGYGFCADNIVTTPKKLLELADMNSDTKKEVHEYLCNIFGQNYKKDELVIEDFIDLEGMYGENGVAAVLFHAIAHELPVIYEQDYDCMQYILYCPSYPWQIKENEKDLTPEKVKEIFE